MSDRGPRGDRTNGGKGGSAADHAYAALAHVTMAEQDREDVVTMGGRDFSRLLPGTRSVPVEELAREQGVRPVESVDDMQAELWDSDEEQEEFVADVRASRQADLA